MVPSYFQADDIPALMEDCGVLLTLGVNSVKALRDEADEEMLNATAYPVVGKAIVFTVQTGSLAGLVVGADVTSESVTYRVRQLMQIGDGALTRVLCSVPS